MSLDDFCRLTPAELDAALSQDKQAEQERFQAGWEQARFMAFAAIAPHSKKVRKPESLMKFPWEKAKKPETGDRRPETDKTRTKADRLAEVSKLIAEYEKAEKGDRKDAPLHVVPMISHLVSSQI
jgi:hypothetical protein